MNKKFDGRDTTTDIPPSIPLSYPAFDGLNTRTVQHIMLYKRFCRL